MVSKIRELCKKNKTSIAALERQLGFGNGVIGRWDKSVPNYDRLCAVANALGVSVSDLTNEATDPEAKKDTTVSGDVSELSDLQREAWNVLRKMDDDTLRAFITLARGKLME